jgi:hypothetical protein
MCDYAENMQSIATHPGIWVISQAADVPCGFLCCVTLDDLGKHDVGDLLFAVISATSNSPSVFEKTAPDDSVRYPDAREVWSRELPWRCLNVMLLVKVGNCCERVAVGQIDHATWKISP